jgi:polyisoprenoid-binding protein YceI
MTLARLASAAALAAALASPALAQAPVLSADPGIAPAGTYALDKGHTRVSFEISHMGLSGYIGWMKDVDATLTFDPAAPEKSAVTVTIGAGSIHTLDPEFDAKLSGPAIMDAAANPQITFKSTAIEKTGDTTGKITGDLTMRGVTKPVTLDVTFNGGLVSPFAKAYVLGFSATGTIKRSEWGMTEYVAFGISDEVKLTVEAEFQHEGAE